MRKVILVFLGAALIAAGVFIAKSMVDSKKIPERKVEKIVKTVFTEKVTNGLIPIQISNTGSLIAKDRVELFAEVQGVFEPNGKEFKPGVKFSKGESIIRINSREHEANLMAQKSSLQNLITGIMSDIRLDYPDESKKWQTYLEKFDVNQPIGALPEASTDKEKFFLSGRNIYTTYYNVKNQEERLVKYSISAPFDGVLTDALVTHGSLIRSGQKLGEFISPSVFELEVAVNRKYLDRLEVGESVQLQDLEKVKQWTGKVIRVNGKLDQQSQTVKVFIQVEGKDLKEGMYLEALLMANEEQDAIEIDRKLLVDEKSVFAINDSVLTLINVTPVYYNENTVVVKGIQNGTEILSKPVPGAYKGMIVKRYDASK